MNTPDRGSGYSRLNSASFDLRHLPPASTVRWVMRRKAEVVTAVCRGLLNVDEACQRYGISMEEFVAWKMAMDKFGPVGLHATRLRRQNSVSRKALGEEARKQKLQISPDRAGR